MSKGIEYWYSKWDKIELSDDEDDVHPIVDKQSWASMRPHKFRVDREREEAMEIKEIEAAKTEANRRIKVLKHDLTRLEEAVKVKEVDSGDDVDVADDDDDLVDDAKGINAELDELMQANELRNKRLKSIEKLKTRNVDNICEVKEERTIINTNAATFDFSPIGFAKGNEDLIKEQADAGRFADGNYGKAVATTSVDKATKTPAAVCAPKSAAATESVQDCAPRPPKWIDSYLEFAAKYSQVVEDFMHLPSLEESREYIVKYGDILLQKNATNYLLFACLEDEMNGHRQKMKQTCHQTRIILAITDLAVFNQQHPGNVVIPFFKKFEQEEFHVGFSAAVDYFCQRIIERAVTKRIELDQERMKEAAERYLEEGPALNDLERLPLEERLGPGGLDPMEVVETLPVDMQRAFKWSNTKKLEEALLSMDSDDIHYHMQRCIASGLWKENA